MTLSYFRPAATTTYGARENAPAVSLGASGARDRSFSPSGFGSAGFGSAGFGSAGFGSALAGGARGATGGGAGSRGASLGSRLSGSVFPEPSAPVSWVRAIFRPWALALGAATRFWATRANAVNMAIFDFMTKGLPSSGAGPR
jgi:hypothetical protein